MQSQSWLDALDEEFADLEGWEEIPEDDPSTFSYQISPVTSPREVAYERGYSSSFSEVDVDAALLEMEPQVDERSQKDSDIDVMSFLMLDLDTTPTFGSFSTGNFILNGQDTPYEGDMFDVIVSETDYYNPLDDLDEETAANLRQLLADQEELANM